MSNIMLPNIVSSARPDSRPDPKDQVDPGNEDNFSRYLDKKVRREQREKNNLVGVKHKSQAKENDSAPAKEDNEVDDKSVVAFLQQLLADLRDLVEKPDDNAGEWSFQLNSMAQLDQMAAQVGMKPEELASLKEQMKDDGTVELADIFALLEKHLQALQEPQNVIAPETDLPTMESILSRMGVDANKLAELSENSIDNQGNFDVAAYLEGLKNMADSESLKAVKISSLEQEQLQDMLAAAGVSKGQLQELFPEKIAAWQRDLAGLPAESLATADKTKELMSFDQLKEMLAQGLQDIQDAKPKVDMPGFLQKLSDVLSQAGFVKGGVGWTPVVQESLTSAYQQLQKMVNLAKVKVDKVSDLMSLNQDLAEQWQASGKITGGEAGSAVSAESKIVEPLLKNANIDLADNNLPDNHSEKSQPGGDSFLNAGTDPSQVGRQSQEFRMPTVVRTPTSQILQQFAMDQLSQAVTQGLRNDEHHLTLTMYPKELGEVKVDLQVRNNHIALSFVMDNHKVKEALEKNMEEFKENLNKQGYSLEACAVMVDQNKNNSDDTRQQFEAAWEQISLNTSGNNGSETAGLADSLQHIAALRSERWPESSISVFV